MHSLPLRYIAAFLGWPVLLLLGSCGGGSVPPNTAASSEQQVVRERALAAAATALTSVTVPVALGTFHTCAVVVGGGVMCWGDNTWGQLGDGTTTSHPLPAPVPGLTGVIAVTAGDRHTCALTAAGGVKCWGGDAVQLGAVLPPGASFIQPSPLDVSGLTSGVVAVSAGLGSTCALTGGGGVKCWGSNHEGEVGDGTTTQRPTPVDVVGLTSGVMAISSGGDHACALTAGGGVKCWGRNESGGLGNGTNIDSTTPVDVSGLAIGVATIASGYADTCAVTTMGGAKCWGDDYYGVLGDGQSFWSNGYAAPSYQLAPVDVVGLTSGVSAIATGLTHSCAVTSIGGLKCWGFNDHGELGDGTTTNHFTAGDVPALASGVAFVAIGSVSQHTCAVTTGGGLMCWGFNYHGQIGDGTNVDRLSPVLLNVAIAAPVSTSFTPNVPVPTATPSILFFPLPSQLYSSIGAFATNSQFSTPTQVFNSSKLSLLGSIANSYKVGAQQIINNWNQHPALVATIEAMAGEPPDTKADALAAVVPFLFSAAGGSTERLNRLTDWVSSIYATVTSKSVIAQFLAVEMLTTNEVVIPGIEIVGLDPVDANYTQVAIAVFPKLPPMPSTLNSELDALLSSLQSNQSLAYGYLQGLNVSYDRYTAAYAAGDPVAAGMQISAMLDYMVLARDTLNRIGDFTTKISALLPRLGFNTNADAGEYLRALQAEVASNGLPSGLTTTLLNNGFSQADISNAVQRFLSMTLSGTSGEAGATLAATGAALLGFPNGPPIANAGPDQTVQCASPSGASVLLNGAGSSDPDGDPLSFAWTGPFGTATGAAPTVTVPVGTNIINLTVSDGKGRTALANTRVVVKDGTPPVATLTLTPAVLWPPNHGLVQITATLQVSDKCDSNPAVSLVSITSNQPDSGLDKEDVPGDIQGATFGTDDRTFLLRAERAGDKANGLTDAQIKAGRTYTVTYRVVDKSGNATMVSGKVFVPYSQ